MVLEEVTVTPEQDYDVICKCFNDLKQHIKDCIEFEDFETLSSYDITRIKELYFQKSALFWKIKVEVVQGELDQVKHDNPMTYEHTIEYCELSIKKLQYYMEQKKAELLAKGDNYSFNRHHKPVIINQIMYYKNSISNIKRFKGIKPNPRKVEVIP